MSTTIKSIFGSSTTIDADRPQGDTILIEHDGMSTSRIFGTADFLAAVATECNVRIVPADAIVIERGELPEVVIDDEGTYVRMASGVPVYLPSAIGGHTAADVRVHALARLALAAYLDANPPKPPVDEAQVAALAAVIDASDIADFETNANYARRLYLAGVRVGTEGAK